MARPPRIEFAGAVYHVTTMAGAGGLVFEDDEDRASLQAILVQALQRFDAQLLAYSFAHDHYQLLLYTRRANLSRFMRHLNGVYTQGYNRRHGGEGSLFKGRFKAVLVDRDQLLLDTCRYVDLSAQRLELVRRGKDWPWHSLGPHTGQEPAPEWLDVQGLFGHVLGRLPRNAADRRRAGERYAELLAAAPDLDIWPHLRQQIFLGNADFTRRMRAQLDAGGSVAARVRRPVRSWAQWLRESDSREQALYRAHTEGGFSMTALAAELELSVSRISRLIASHERSLQAVAE